MNRPTQNDRLVIQVAQGVYQILMPNTAKIGPNWMRDSAAYTREGVVTKIERTVYDPRFFNVRFFAPEPVRSVLGCEYVKAIY